MKISYIRFEASSENVVIISKSYITEVSLLSADKELEARSEINMHDLKYYDFKIDDMTAFDINLSLSNQVSAPIRFLRKLGVDDNVLFNVAVSDVGEDFYRFITEKLGDINASIDVTEYCKEFLSQLDGLSLTAAQNIDSSVNRYIGNIMCHYNEEKLRRQYTERSEDIQDKRFVNLVLSLIELGEAGQLQKGAFYQELPMARNEYLKLMSADLTSSVSGIIDQFPNELNEVLSFQIRAANSVSNISTGLTMLSVALIEYFGKKDIAKRVLIDTTNLRFQVNGRILLGLKAIYDAIKDDLSSYGLTMESSKLKDKLVINEMTLPHPRCHDYIILIKALQYGYMHNLTNPNYCLLPVMELSWDKDGTDISSISIRMDDKELNIRPGEKIYKGFNHTITDDYEEISNNSIINRTDMLQYF